MTNYNVHLITYLPRLGIEKSLGIYGSNAQLRFRLFPGNPRIASNWCPANNFDDDLVFAVNLLHCR